MGNNSSHRIAFWDNVKTILILLVVMGHFLLPVSPKGQIVFSIFIFIYLFHMPAFVFVSGYFSRRYVEKGASDIRRLVGFLVLYVFFSISIWIIKMLCKHDTSMLFIFTASEAPWYLLCMFLWYCMIPYCAKFRPLSIIALSVLAGLLVGFERQAGDFLALSRCFVFFPFFLLGYHFDIKTVLEAKPSIRIVSGIMLVALFVLIWMFPAFFAQHEWVIYGAIGYSNMVSGLMERLVWYIIVTIIIAAFFYVVPRKRYFFTYIGQRTLAIYIIHRLIREICQHLGFFKMLSSDFISFVSCFAISVVITFALSAKKITDLFNKAFSAQYKHILKE